MNKLVIAFFLAQLLVYQHPKQIAAPQSSTNSSRSDFLNGTWTYRSYHSDPNLDATPQSLLYGVWELDLKVDSFNQVSGTMSMGGWSMNLNGEFASGDPGKLKLNIAGKVAGEQRQYLAEGYISPNWNEGVGQRPAFVGSIVRQSDNRAKKNNGYVAQWIAVKQDSDDNAPVRSLGNQAWTLTATSGDEVTPESLSGKRSVIVFSQGFDCLHCAQQIQKVIEQQQEFKRRSTEVFVFVADSNESLTRALGDTKTAVRFISDPDQTVFAEFGCADRIPMHGLFVIGKDGKCHWYQRGDRPWMGFNAILECLDQLTE